MKTTRKLSELFEQARKAAPEVPVSDIKTLVETGKTSPLAARRSFRPRRITQMFNPLKILIMITPIIIITSALLTWNAENQQEQVPESLKIKNEKVSQIGAKEKVETPITNDQSRSNPAGPKSTTSPELSMGVPVDNSPSSAKDTTLQGVILELTNKELTRLGFRFTSNGFMFLNRMEDGRYLSFVSYKDKFISEIYLDVKEDIHYLIDKDTTSLDFYPEAISNQQGNLWYDIATKKLKDQKVKDETDLETVWEHVNDTLVPVKISAELTGGYDELPIILWFKASDSFFSIIGSERSSESQKIWRAAKEMSLSGGLTNHVAFTYQPYKEPENLLALSSDVFRCLGFNFDQGEFTFYEYLHNIWIRFNLREGCISYLRNQVPTNPGFSGISTAILEMHQKSKVGMHVMNLNLIYEVYHQDSVEGIPFNDALELCIPVKIADTTLNQRLQNYIFWIFPNDRFLECLPSEIAGPMRKELNYQLKRMDPNFVPRMGGSIGIGGDNLRKDAVYETVEPVPCVYFTNLCESLTGLDYVNLYPNPATDKLNVDLVLQRAKNIRFRVFDLGGRVIFDEGSPENFPDGGQFTHQMDVSKLQNGFYLLVMTDEEGAKLTRRFVKN